MQHPYITQASKLPMPLAAWSLGLASLANMLQSNLPKSERLVWLVQGAAVLVGCLVVIKLLASAKLFWQQLQDPLQGAVAPTFAMAAMILSQSLPPYWRLLVWSSAVILHIGLLLVFIRVRCKHWRFDDMVPSWFIPPVGLLVAVVSCPSLQQLLVVQWIGSFAVLCFALMLPVMLYRLARLTALGALQQNTLTVLAAPSNLTLVAYFSYCQLTAQTPHLAVCLLTYVLASLLNIRVYLLLPRLLRQPFHPSFAAFTFPFVIGAVATSRLCDLLATEPQWGGYQPFFSGMALWQQALALVLVTGVSAGYVKLACKQVFKWLVVHQDAPLMDNRLPR